MRPKHGIGNIAVSSPLNRALEAKFFPCIRLHLNRLKEHKAISTDQANLQVGQTLRIYIETGWSLLPHKRTMLEVIQSFIYLPTKDRPTQDQKDLGPVKCRFTKPQGSPAETPNCNRDYKDGVIHVTSAPYGANQLFAFMTTPASPHRTPTTKGLPDRRYVFTKLAPRGADPGSAQADQHSRLPLRSNADPGFL